MKTKHNRTFNFLLDKIPWNQTNGWNNLLLLYNVFFLQKFRENEPFTLMHWPFFFLSKKFVKSKNIVRLAFAYFSFSFISSIQIPRSFGLTLMGKFLCRKKRFIFFVRCVFFENCCRTFDKRPFCLNTSWTFSWIHCCNEDTFVRNTHPVALTGKVIWM